MSSIVRHLEEQDIQLEKTLKQQAPTYIPSHPIPIPGKPKLNGIKISIFFSIFLAALALLGVAYNYYSLLLERQQRLALETAHMSLSERSVALEAAIQDQKDLAARIDGRLTRSLDKEAVLRDEIRREVEKRRLEILNLQKKIRMLEDGQSQFMTAAGSSVPAVETPKAVAAADVSQNQTSFQPAVGPAMHPAAGKERVLTINRQFKFVVINLGSNESVRAGDMFQVIRGSQKIAALKIEKLYDSFSAANILEEDAAQPIQVGDAVQKIQ